MSWDIDWQIILKQLACPRATQDLMLNTKNRDAAVKNPKKSNCSNCVAFDISPRMEKCMPLELDDDGRLGYCWMHDFKCHSARTCYTWAKGGPITDDKRSKENQMRKEK